MRYRLKAGAPRHYHAGRFYEAGEEIDLPPEIKPGQWLEPEAAPVAAVACVEEEVGAAAPISDPERPRGRKAKAFEPLPDDTF